MKRGWAIAGLAVVALIAGSVGLLYWNPGWVLDRTIDFDLWRHGVTQHDVQVDGHRIHYLEAKSKGGGPERPVVLIHGLGARASNWSKMMPLLAADGYHVYALDLLGYGDSEKPKNATNADYSLAGEERVAIAYMQAMGLQTADVAGWSMGGWVAMKLALDKPEMVRRLMLFDSAGLYFQMNFPLTLFGPTNREEFARLTRQIEPDKPITKVPSIVVDGLLRRFKENQPIVDASFRSMLTGSELLDFRVHRLKMPVLIVWGTEDKLTPLAVGLRLHALVPQSVFLGIGGCGHLLAAECVPQAMPPVLQFLKAEPPMAASTTTLPSVR